MTETSERALALRSAFDQGFAAPLPPPPPLMADYLAIRVGAQRHAIALGEVVAVHVDRRIVRIPSTHPALLGLAGLRGAIVPVYDLRVLVGDAGRESTRWLLVTAGEPLAMAFDGFEGLIRVPETSVVAGAAEIVASEDDRRSVLSIASLSSEIRRRAGVPRTEI